MAKPTKKVLPKKLTRFTGETQIGKKNKEILEKIRAWKGSFG
jgi:hypothetical protein